MELRHIRYFLAVAEELHFGRAASRLNMSQPPLSRQIRQLEEEIGAPLFDRTRQTVRLTEAGKAFLMHAYDILKKIEEARMDALAAYEGRKGTIVISYASSMNEVLMNIILAFRRRFPETDLRVQQSLSNEIIRDLREERIHIGVMPPVEESGLKHRTISVSPFGVVFSRNHRFATEKAPLSIADLKEEPFVLSFRNTLFNNNVKAICQLAGFTPQVAQEMHGLSAILTCVASGAGISIVSRLTMEQHQHPNLMFRELHPRMVQEIAIIWRKEETSPAVLHFLDFAEAWLKEHGIGTFGTIIPMPGVPGAIPAPDDLSAPSCPTG